MLTHRSRRTLRHHFFVIAVALAGFALGAPTTLRAAAASSGPAHYWTSLFVFGDSYSDSGAGYVDCNGPTAVVYMAKGLGTPFTYYGAPDMAGKGINFAVSGARTDAGKGRRIHGALLARGMEVQVDEFVAGVKAGTITFDPARTLFFLEGGLNDSRMKTAATVHNLEDEIHRLYDAGGRHFFLTILPTKVPAFAKVARRLNPAIERIPAEIGPRLPGADVRLSRWGEYYDEVMEHAARYGFTNTTEACAGRSIFNQDPTPKGDPNTYFFYHGSHPSTAVHRIVGRELVREAEAAAESVLRKSR